jgi:hypothetical protein
VPRTKAEARTVDGGLDRRKVRLTLEQRAERNALIMQYYLAARPERWIAAHPRVQLSQQRVHQIIAEQLKSAASRQGLLSEHAMTVYVERLEFLYGRVAPKAAEGDLKAIEVGRRLLEQYARLYDLNEERSPALMPPMSDDELDMMDEDSPAYQSLDDLTKYRLRAHRKEASR